ncbi:uncharacterized protein [Miscanthus floridulus]|uniref:uncharacterized protein isoform X3 n=1 Tax=Miscanthus floridulus TaxID=154761 RepID=UPI00345A8F0F
MPQPPLWLSNPPPATPNRRRGERKEKPGAAVGEEENLAGEQPESAVDHAGKERSRAPSVCYREPPLRRDTTPPLLCLYLARFGWQPEALAIVAAAPTPTAIDVQAPFDDVTGLPLIMCPDCKDVRLFAATTTKSQYNVGRRFFKCPRKNYSNGTCSRYWFEEEYVVYLEDHGYLLPPSSTIAAASTSEVPELVGKIDSLEQSLNEVKEMVGKNREGMGSCICLVCGCLNVTIFLVLAILLVVALVLK